MRITIFFKKKIFYHIFVYAAGAEITPYDF